MKDRVLGIATLAALIAALYFALIYAPTEATMGTVQRIFYFHVPAGIMTYVAFAVVGTGSIIFLTTRKPHWDRLAYCAAEAGAVFGALNLGTGMLWAKPVWGDWWVWDPRLTLQLMVWLMFIAYLMLGAYISDPTKRAPLQAVFGIFGMANSVMSYLAIRLFRNQHPSPVIGGGEESGLDPQMYVALGVSMAAVLLLFTYLVRRRIDLEKNIQEVDYLEQVVLSR